VVQVPFVAGLSDSEVAVTAPVSSGVPDAVTQPPTAMSFAVADALRE
jgi:hypothetical protein